MSVGRKELWPPEAYFEIVRAIGEGTNLVDAMGKGKPGKTAFYARLREDPQLAKAYETALTMRADAQVDALLEVNKRLLEGRIDPQSARVLSDNLKWLSGKNNPRLYGETSRTEITGRDGAPLIVDRPKMNDFDLARLVAHIFDKAGRATVDKGELLALPESAE